MRSPKDQIIEYVPKMNEEGSKLGLMGCAIQLLLGAFAWLFILTFLVFIAMII
jgi:hypothetical protein